MRPRTVQGLALVLVAAVVAVAGENRIRHILFLKDPGHGQIYPRPGTRKCGRICRAHRLRRRGGTIAGL